MRLRFVIMLMSVAVLGIGVTSVGHAEEVSLRFSVNEELADQLKSVSLLKPALEGQAQSDLEILAAAQADYQRYLSVLYANGYYGADIRILLNGREATQYSAFDTVGPLRKVEVLINEGRLFVFGAADIAPLARGTELPQEFATGQVARSPVIQKSIDTALDAWRNEGRAKVKVSELDLVADHSKSQFDARVSIEPGRTAKFGVLSVEGHKNMRENRIRKIAGLQEGARYTPSQMEDAANRLRDTGIFSSVIMTEADEISPDGTLDVTVKVAESKPRRLGLGAEISTPEGVSLEGFWMHRNIFGGGEKLRFDAEVKGIGGDTEGIDYKVGASLIRPATFTPDTQAGIKLAFESEDEDTYEIRSYSIGFGVVHKFSDRLRAAAGIEYSYTDAVDVFGPRDFLLIGLPLSVTYDTRDGDLSPKEGVYMYTEVQPFYDLERENIGTLLWVDGRTYYGLGAERKFVLAGRVQLGSIVGPDLMDIPPDYLFYSGGSDTVRGQDYQSLGVTLPGGGETGGKSYGGFSAELRAPLYRAIGGVLFADYGYVGRGSKIGVDGDSQAGVGIGLRFETGFGPMRFDVAAPLGEAFEVGNLNIYIGIGQAF